jgi:hypothetical protein
MVPHEKGPRGGALVAAQDRKDSPPERAAPRKGVGTHKATRRGPEPSMIAHEEGPGRKSVCCVTAPARTALYAPAMNPG